MNHNRSALLGRYEYNKAHVKGSHFAVKKEYYIQIILPIYDFQYRFTMNTFRDIFMVLICF